MGNKIILPPEERRVRVVQDMRAHFEAALRLPFPMDSRLRATALSPDMQCAVRIASSFNGTLGDRRRQLIQWHVDLSHRLRPISKRINQLMPPSVFRISANVNTALMAVWIDALGWLDTALVERFVHGFPIVGDIPDSGVYRPIAAVTPAAHAARYQLFRDSALAWDSALVLRLRQPSPGQREANLAVAEKTWKEVSKGAVVGPYTTLEKLHVAVAAGWPNVSFADTIPRLLNRFGVPQNGGTRAIDDGRSNGANAATRLVETVTTPTFFTVGVAARAFAAYALHVGSPLPPLTTTLLDLTMAYRTIPTSQPWYTSIAFRNPSSERVELYWLPGHNFGLTSAVVNFNRHPELVTVAARAFLAVVVDHYYDDFIAVDLAAGDTSAREAIEALVLALGAGEPRKGTTIKSPEIDPAKTKPTAAVNVVLGIVADLSETSHGRMEFYVDPDRARSILKTFRDAFERNHLAPHEAASLRGKLLFALSAAFGMVGRAATLPLVQRQYRDHDHSFAAGSELHHSLLFFEALLPALPRLSVQLTPTTTPPLLVYTDASFHRREKKRQRDGECITSTRFTNHGALGAVVYDPVDNTVRYAAADPPWAILLSSWNADSKTYIAELETLAAVAVYSTYPELFAGRKVNHFVDNTVALSALIHGYSNKKDLAKPVNIFHLQSVALRTSVYFEYVPSKANIADLPSRRRFVELERVLAGVPRRGRAPDLLATPSAEAWDADLKSWVTNPRTWHANMPL